MSARAWTAVLGLSLVGCAGLFEKSGNPLPSCKSDSDCPSHEVCFVDGCGDPGKDIAVEVTPSSRNGAYPQDFAIGELKASQTLQLFAPSTLQGALLREQDGGGAVPYAGTVSVVLNGQSKVIPGLSRHFEATVTGGVNGAYSIPVGSGVYAISATPSDATIPPLFDPSREIDPGQSDNEDLVLPSPGALVTLSGTVVEVAGTPATAALQVQAFGSDGQPLSQRVALGTDGSFALSVAEETLGDSQISLRVTPVDPTAALPTKTFDVSPATLFSAPFELGAYGDPFTVTGALVDARGAPVAGASVHLEGEVIGGGSFRSQTSQSAGDGTFSLVTLAGGPDAGLTLVAVPAADGTPGILTAQVDVSPTHKTLGSFTCPDKIAITGQVLTPDGSPAPGVSVTAVPIAAADATDAGHPLPSEGAEAISDTNGQFTFALDPAGYRLDFVPAQKLPRVSRFLDVPASAQPTGSLPPLEPFTLSNGRSASGHIEVLSADGGTPEVAPLARVRFYRQVQNGDTPSSILLDQTYADQNGDFTVLLPSASH